jgi:hypothetical protein
MPCSRQRAIVVLASLDSAAAPWRRASSGSRGICRCGFQLGFKTAGYPVRRGSGKRRSRTRPDSAANAPRKKAGPSIRNTAIAAYRGRASSGPVSRSCCRDALDRRFTILVTESLDRLSRDQEDIAHLFKRIGFAGGRIVTLSEGEINELHIGLKGTMGALYLKDLADKTRRGLRGRVEAGKSGGGNSYGYDVVRGVGPDGQPLTGERRINAREAAIVRRVFEDYAAGVSRGRSPKR